MKLIISFLLLVAFSTAAFADPVITPIVATIFAAMLEVGVGMTVALTIADALLIVLPIAIGVGVSLGAGAIASALSKKPSLDLGGASYAAPTPQVIQQTVRQTVAPRRRHYGVVKVGGVICFYQSVGGKLYILVITGHGEIDSVEELWLGENLVSLDGSGFVTDAQYTYASVKRVQLVSKLGTFPQTAQSILISAFPYNASPDFNDTYWTTDHRLDGMSNTLIVMQDVPSDAFTTVYPSGPPPFRAVLAASKVYDPRDPVQSPGLSPDVWTWSENPALCILDFLTHADGMNRPRSMFDTASFADAADICDELIDLHDETVERRYSLSGSYDLVERPVDVLQRMLAVCDGEIFQQADGTYGLRVGKWEAPTVTIADSVVLSYQMEQGSDALSAFNVLKITYVSPLHDYQETEAEYWRDEESIAALGEEKNDSIQLLMCSSPSQARRLAKIVMAKSNPTWKGSIRTTLAGLAAMGERYITLQLAELEINETFQIAGFSLAPDLSSCDISLFSMSSSAYDWDPATEEGDPPPPLPDAPLVATLAVPVGFVVRAASILISGSTYGAVFVADWDAPSRDTITHELNYKLSTDSEWISVLLVAGVVTWRSGLLQEGLSYNVRLRAKTVTGSASAWTSTATIVASSAASPA